MRRVILIGTFIWIGLMALTMPIYNWSRVRAGQSSELAEANRLTNTAMKLYEGRKYDQAIPLLMQALGIVEKSAGTDDPTVAVILDKLSTVYSANRQYSDAESVLQRSLRIREKAFGANSLETSQSVFDLGDLYQTNGILGRAISFYDRALAIRERLLKPGDVNTVITAFRYSCVLRKSNRPKDAEGIEAGSQLNRDKQFPQPPAGSTLNNGGIRTGKLISSPQPTGVAGNQRHASGKVRVNVLIDENGTVINACALTGDPLLWPYAEAAAYQARYSPTTLMGIPIRTPGTLSFDFQK